MFQSSFTENSETREHCIFVVAGNLSYHFWSGHRASQCLKEVFVSDTGTITVALIFCQRWRSMHCPALREKKRKAASEYSLSSSIPSESVIKNSSNSSWLMAETWDPAANLNINISIFPINLITFHMLIWIGHALPLCVDFNPNLITNYTVGGWLDQSFQRWANLLSLMSSTFYVWSLPGFEDKGIQSKCLCFQ